MQLSTPFDRATQLNSSFQCHTSATPTTGEIRGSQWNDLNGSGVRDEQEPGLAGWTIYLDDNRNGQLDAGERSTITDTSGNYILNNLATLVGVGGGMTFDPTRDILYAANSSTDQIIAFDTATWRELYRFNNIGKNVPGDALSDVSSRPLKNGVMTTSDDGRFLFMSTPNGIRMFDLVAVSGGSEVQRVTLPVKQVATGINFISQRLPA